MKPQTAFIVAIFAFVLWLTWEYALAIILWLFGLGVWILIYDWARLLVLYVIFAAGVGIWFGARWLLRTVAKGIGKQVD